MSHTLIYHPDYQTYNFGPAHPFSPVRLEMLVTLLDALGARTNCIEPPLATPNDIYTVHGEAFVAQVEAASQGTPQPDAHRYGLDTSDVPIFSGMDRAARMLVGGTLQAARMIADGTARRVLQLGGGLHHAQYALASGFCVYNDPAVAIRHLRSKGLRVAYIDIDVHHGDGVQWLFYNEPEVLTISLHESGRYLYPGTGSMDELGHGNGKGFSLNVPLMPYTPEASYLDVFEQVVPHALAMFKPDMLHVECGADAHAADPLAHLQLTTRTYESLFRRLLDLADEHTDGRILLTLGGGYDLDATTRVWTLLALLVQNLDLPERLPDAWLDRWQQHLGRSLTAVFHDPERAASPSEAVIRQNREISRQLLQLAEPYW